ncbi:putative phage tail protein [Aneurinibacillus migulanus]|uniref:putative phage tail protein n=1 Tax=Aneurinibacillus migulanus TaxID=47500 RepID=UPI000698E4F4|nr:putative phage tail protein [Aneurinibacillus migulanus]CEH29486.1 Uncharacterized protein BN1090_A2_01923 [Aneurinibacillus migulanus]
MSERVDRAFYSLPRYYQSSQITEEIIHAAMKEFDYDEQERDDIFAQLLIVTATWGLERWEKEFGVQHAPGDSYELRRARLEAKVISKSKSNPKRIEEIVNSFVPSKSAKVYRIPDEYAFEAFVPVDELQWMPEIIKAVEKAKPAHLEFILTGIYRAESIIVGGDARNFDVTYRRCGETITEGVRDGQLAQAGVNVLGDVYGFAVPYQRCGEAYTGEEA